MDYSESYDLPQDGVPSSETELMRDQAAYIGEQRRDRAWISTSWDIWEPNPHYQGPPQPHPEDY
ncbi:hypothetical protein VRRI112168_02865 [Vreelandella rituensis]|uniref:Uncharacterized protein n=1 Tax=Vreelandella rituensis TaxID=2282306 RepID=A0A368UAN6_9GAMM|nr:hypothetical protein [Halomonas rituensis]RCV93686.1 hypothetical protein DU506_00585 [Halomonas rituensis]